MKKALTIGLVILLALSCLTACGKEKSTALKVGTEPGYMPFEYTDENDHLIGFDIDLMNAIAADQGMELEWVNMGFDGLIPALQTGNLDIVIAGMNINEERVKAVDFSTPYYDDEGLALCVAADNTTIQSMDDLTAEMKVGVQLATTSFDVAQTLQEEGKIAEAVAYDLVPIAFENLALGTVQAVINNVPVTKAYMAAQPGKVKIVGESFDDEHYGIAVEKGNQALLDKINAGLANIKKSGKYDELFNKWLAE